MATSLGVTILIRFSSGPVPEAIRLPHQLLNQLAYPFDPGTMRGCAVLVDDARYFVHRRIERVVDHDVTPRARLANFGDRLLQAPCQRRRRLGPAAQQSLRPIRPTGREDEDPDRLWRRVALLHLTRALDLDVQHDVLAGAEHGVDLTLERTVPLAGVLRPLHELIGVPAPCELLPGHEVVGDVIRFPRTRPPRGRRHRVPHVRPPRQQRLRDRRFPAPRGGGQHDDPRRHSRFSSCSRNFSSSPFIAITVWVIAASFALEPIVFTSRSSSCARKPNCFPTRPSLRNASRHAARCVRSRTSSSVTSTRSARSAISRASRCSSTCTPAASSATAFLRRASSALSRSGARCSIARAPASSPSSRAASSAASARPSRARIASTSCAARSTIGSTSLQATAPAPSLCSFSTSGCRATNARSRSPLSLSRFLSSFAAATTRRARTKSTLTPASPAGGWSQRADTATWPRSSSCRSRSRSVPSIPPSSNGSLNCGL